MALQDHPPDRPSRDARLIADAINGSWFSRGVAFGAGLCVAVFLVGGASAIFWFIVLAVLASAGRH